jgi:hypothetical protein
MGTPGAFANRADMSAHKVCECGHIKGIHHGHGPCRICECGEFVFEGPTFKLDSWPNRRSEEYYRAMRSFDVG